MRRRTVTRELRRSADIQGLIALSLTVDVRVSADSTDDLPIKFALDNLSNSIADLIRTAS